MRVLSLFDGVSCGMVALKSLDVKIDRYVAFEVDKYAISVSTKHHPEIEQRGDVFGTDFKEFKGFDLIMAGSPCTFWSIAKRDREISTSGNGWKFFAKVLDAIRNVKPKHFIYENVANMPNTIKDHISNSLSVEPIMINSSLVSAQTRKRLYWTNIPIIAQPEDRHIFLKDIVESGYVNSDKAYCLTANYSKTHSSDMLKAKRTQVFETIRIESLGKGRQGNRAYSIHDKSVCLFANGSGRGAKTGLYKIDLPDGSYIIRKLTPIECERLQTLPDNYTVGVSNTQRYKMIGNGWTIDVIKHILNHLK